MSRFILSKHKTPAFSLESADIAAAAEPSEDALMAIESTEGQAEIDSDVETLTSLEERAIGLEDLAEVVEENVGEATAGEIALVDVAQDLAGVGIDGVEVEGTFDETVVPAGDTPALEHFVGSKISTEGMRTMAADIWKVIEEVASKIWDKIMDIWNSLTDQSKSVAKAAKQLGVKAGDKGGAKLKEDKDTMKLGGTAKTLMVDNKAPKTAAEVSTILSDVKKIATEVLDGYAKAVEAAGPKLASAMDFTIDKDTNTFVIGGHVNKVNILGSDLVKEMRKIASTSISGDSRFSSDSSDFYRSAHLPQNKMIVLTSNKNAHDKKAAENAGVSAWSAAVRSCALSVSASHDKPASVKDAEMKPLTPKQVGDLSDEISALCAVVAAFNEKTLRKMQKGRNSLKAAGKKLTGQITDETDRSVVTAAKATAQYNVAYSKWCASPFSSVSGIALTTCRGAIAVGEKSLACYG